jgi:hypothetical protein
MKNTEAIVALLRTSVRLGPVVVSINASSTA